MKCHFASLLLTTIAASPTAACVGEGGDPWWSGSESPCCAGLKSCLEESAGWAYRCRACDASCPSSTDAVCVEAAPTKPSRIQGDRAPFKRGLALATIEASALETLEGTISWGYTWRPSINHGNTAPASTWAEHSVEFIPMVWSDAYVGALPGNLPPTDAASALLGFNEPNINGQAEMTPESAAANWPKVIAAASDRNIPIVVSPAMTYGNWNGGPTDPNKWLDRFFAACDGGCHVDAIAIHSYTCKWAWLKAHIDIYRIYNKPIWLTEFMCAESGDVDIAKDQAGQMAFMREVIPELEADPDIYRYAWFGYDGVGEHGGAGALLTGGALNPLGELYFSLAGEPAVEEVAPTPAPTAPPTTTLPSTPASQTIMEEEEQEEQQEEEQDEQQEEEREEEQDEEREEEQDEEQEEQADRGGEEGEIAKQDTEQTQQDASFATVTRLARAVTAVSILVHLLV